jgi:hypothetical protein
MSDRLQDIPARVTPYVVFDELNQPVLVAAGPFRFVGPAEGSLDSDLVFRWVPSTAVAFEGSCSLPSIDLDTQWSLGSDDPSFDVPVLVTSTTFGTGATRVKGIVQGASVLPSQLPRLHWGAHPL